MPMNVGPSPGFMQRMKQNLPMAVGTAMQNAGPDYMRPMASAVGNIMQRRRMAGGGGNPNTTGRQTTQQNGPQGMAPTGPSPSPNQGELGIVRGPSVPPPTMMGPGMDTPMMMGGNGMDAPGLWAAYMAQQQRRPPIAY